MSAAGADSATEKLRQVRRGQAVATITLPSGHRILVDPHHGEDGEALVARINKHGALCSSRIRPMRAVKQYLKRAAGAIEIERSRRDCPGWPGRLTDLGRDSG